MSVSSATAVNESVKVPGAANEARPRSQARTSFRQLDHRSSVQGGTSLEEVGNEYSVRQGERHDMVVVNPGATV